MGLKLNGQIKLEMVFIAKDHSEIDFSREKTELAKQ